jgi:hypothetical protein
MRRRNRSIKETTCRPNIFPRLQRMVIAHRCVKYSDRPGGPTRGCPVCTENLSSGVVVVKSAQNGACTDHTGSLNRARNRRILVQGSVRSDAIVIVGVGFQDPTQMHLAQDNDVVRTFTSDRSDQPFGNAILPRRGWCGRLVPDAHGAQSARDDAAIDPIPIADVVARSLIPGNASVT